MGLSEEQVTALCTFWSDECERIKSEVTWVEVPGFDIPKGYAGGRFETYQHCIADIQEMLHTGTLAEGGGKVFAP